MKATIRTQVFLLRLKDAFVKMFVKKYGFEIANVKLREMPNCYQFTYICNGGRCALFVSKVKEILDYMMSFTRECGEQMTIIAKKLGVQFTDRDLGQMKFYANMPKVDSRRTTNFATISYSPFHDRWVLDLFHAKDLTARTTRFVSFEQALKFAIEKSL